MRPTSARSFSLALLLHAGAVSAAPHPFGFDDLIKARRLGAYSVSPDGRWVAYTLSTPDVEENTSSAAIWLEPAASGEPRRVTAGKKHDTEPRFFADGKHLAFLSDRDGAPQVYVLHLGGGEPRAVTQLPGGVADYVLAPDGTFLIAASETPAECATISCSKERLERMAKAKVTGRVIDRLLYRHWDAFADGKRTHLYRVALGEGPPSEARDLTPGNWDAPGFSLGGPRGFDLSPDGKTLVYASNHDRVEATSTNTDLWLMPAAGGTPRNLTADNRGADFGPRFAPDGKHLAWLSQRTPGYESDKVELKVLALDGRAAPRALTAALDASVGDLAWKTDSQGIVFTALDKGRMPIYEVPLDNAAPAVRSESITAADPAVLADGTVLFVRTSLKRPAELWRLPPGPRSTAQAVTHINDALFASVSLGEVRERWYDAKDGRRIHAFYVTPPGFDPKRRYPALFWVHGGPQGAWEDAWTYRWNAEVLASAGYVVYLPNPRGSTGYGQAFVREISGDWGGKVFDDLMRGVDDLERLPFVDRSRVGAAGASFGGFMINWFQGHTDRFRALFCHDGIADQESMYATEELWFPEFEMKGTPLTSPLYREHSPIAQAARFRTPELIVHGEKDYRIPVEQALLMFSLLQRQGVPSRLLLFPDENHWVLRPANSRLWYASMIDWFHGYLGGTAADPEALKSAYSVTR
jgi:dipeptidyl aminopeptidase/acylaminoacyl peptidase